MQFIKSLVRNLYYHKFFTAINIIGLAIGLACFTFIFLYILDETSYDKYHQNYKRIYRLESDITISDKHQQVAKTSFAIGPAFYKEFPEIEAFVRFREIYHGFLRYEDKKFYEDNLYYCDSSVFKVFTHKFISGDPDQALNKPNCIVLTESLATKYFGDNNPIGKIIVLSNVISCKVTGIIEDLPDNSHLNFDGLVSIETINNTRKRLKLVTILNASSFSARLLNNGRKFSTKTQAIKNAKNDTNTDSPIIREVRFVLDAPKTFLIPTSRALLAERAVDRLT